MEIPNGKNESSVMIVDEMPRKSSWMPRFPRSIRYTPRFCTRLAHSVAIAAILFFATSCATTHYKKKADQEAYALIAEKAPKVPNMEEGFSIEENTEDFLTGLPVVEEVNEALGEMGKTEQGAACLSLEKALAIAVNQSRTYQNRKESLYLQALSLTLDRHAYTPILAVSASGKYERVSRDVTVVSDTAQLARAAPDLAQQLGQLAGAPADVLSAYAKLIEDAATATGANQSSIKTLDERRVTGNTRLGVDLLLQGGARMAIDLSSDFLRFLTGDPRVSASSALAATLRQPLLRGAGRSVAAENLTQAERDLLYELRSFAQFRKEFVTQVASNYYQVLQTRDAVMNNYRGYLAFQQSAQRERALATQGRSTQAGLGRIEQALLNSENSWVNSIRSYAEELDRFKILLGLSTDAHVALDPRELEQLRERGLIHPAISSEDAVKVALVTRLDLYSIRDREEDANRKVNVAINALKPQLDLVVQGSVNSMPGNRFQELDFQRGRWSAGLDFDPGFDRKAERNAYRASLISLARASRERELAEDTAKLAVRESWRNLDQAKRTFEIQQIGVGLNERRVEEQALLSELGRATAQNQVDAQNDLINARNDLTAALVRHTVARLQFWRDMGILFIKENGQWEEVTDVVKPQE